MLPPEHGSGYHGHSHGALGKSTSRLTHMIATDDNENDESFCAASANNPPLNNDSDDMNHTHNSSAHLNMRGIFLHVLADALGSVIVVVSASVSFILIL